MAPLQYLRNQIQAWNYERIGFLQYSDPAHTFVGAAKHDANILYSRIAGMNYLKSLDDDLIVIWQ